MKPSMVIACLLIVAGTLAHVRRQGEVGTSPAPGPNAATRAALGPVVAARPQGRSDGVRLAGFYSSLADVLARDAGRRIVTTAQLRELHRRAGLLAFARTGVDGKYPGLAEAIDRYLAEAIGLENVPLDDRRRAAAIAAFGDLAWACGGGR